jgi:peptide-methionine (R)-S-oxide reductase
MSGPDDKRLPGEDELRARLTDEQIRITQDKGTERAFTGRYLHNKEQGVYMCVVCGAELFASDTKYDSGSGWPSFWLPLAGDRVATHRDASHGMVRTEVTCAHCGASLPLERTASARAARYFTAGFSEYVPVSRASASTCGAMAAVTCGPVNSPSTGQRARSSA